EIKKKSNQQLNTNTESADHVHSAVQIKPVSTWAKSIHAKNIVILVNPNNPDGKLIPRSELEQFMSESCMQDNWLIIDEAFMDLSPDNSAVGLTGHPNCVVLKSFGKFFGLAGLRLGFVIGPEFLIERLSLLLGPWPVGGPSLEVGAIALADKNWQNEMRIDLQNKRNRLDLLLQKYNYKVIGGSNLFQLIETDVAGALFTHLLQHKIYIRRFNRFPDRLRIGIPSLDIQFSRLETGLRTFRTTQ
ncbi:MAG: aminotransferase class I/II-fold pyridoxal phosphate-dependent enzyme, partial [Desulfobulbia bacterium]